MVPRSPARDHLSKLYPRGFERYATRALEGYMGTFDVLYGLLLMMPHWDTMEAAVYAPLLKVMGETAWGFAFLIRGVLHLTALYINGRAWWTPWARAAASGVSALFWACFGTALLFVPDFKPGLVLTLAITAVIFHIYCLRRSARDAGMAVKPHKT